MFVIKSSDARLVHDRKAQRYFQTQISSSQGGAPLEISNCLANKSELEIDAR